METREPTMDDVEELRSLIDAQESGLDENHKPASAAWPIELLRGHNDPPHNQLWTNGDRILAWASMQPDAHRRRIEVELFRQPGYEHMGEVWNWCRDIAQNEFPGWVMWVTVNYRDSEMAEIFASTGYELLRRYHLLTRPLGDDTYPELPTNASIEVITTDSDFVDWHTAHQDSFSQHFGFTPRPADQWIPHFRDYEGADPEGRFLLRVDGEVAGFVSCTNDNAHENGGFVDVLGVRHDFQGRGYGELLLRWAFAYCASRGFTDADLAVDTGNVSGALGLYSKVGLTTLSEYHLFAQPAQ